MVTDRLLWLPLTGRFCYSREEDAVIHCGNLDGGFSRLIDDDGTRAVAAITLQLFSPRLHAGPALARQFQALDFVGSMLPT